MISRRGAPAPARCCRRRRNGADAQSCAGRGGHEDEHEPDDHDRACGEPGNDQGSGVELLPREERAEDERAECGAEEGAEEDVGDSARAPRRAGTCRRLRRARAGPFPGRCRRARTRGRRAARIGPVPSAVDETADDAGDTASRQHGDPADLVHQLAGGERGQRRGDEEDRRPEAQDALDARDEDERDGRNGDRQLDHAGEARQGGRKQDGVPADRKAVHKPSLSERRREPCPKRRRAAARGMADIRPTEARVGDPADRDRPADLRRARRGTARSLRSPLRVGGRFELSVPGCVGTTFQRRTSLSIPSSASTAWTMVAVASAGPVPVSWRSEVRGMPEMRVPR